ncbi:hypothetical protein [Aestuariivirga litoralis]|uniref:hypothetical protein n=1 Tax=Aestuariivirga litoralis TaxID=2650924 RepID=UPI0018C53569|nr:hypothetical protein [Aestuariivirga litoralis]MBG1233162.1 hypothetical protein [Aestuariivirga litoralis]
MPKLNENWIVQPHGPLVKVATGLMTVEGSIVMPLGQFPRRMTVVELCDGGSAIWSAVPLDEAAMGQIESLGPVRFIIVPNQGHRLDVHAWAKRYPDAKIIAPPRGEAVIREAAPVDATRDIINDPALHFGLVNGMKLDEFTLSVRRAEGVTLILNDILANVRHPKGLGANVMARLFGFGVSRPRTSRFVHWRYVSDNNAVAQQFHHWAAIADLRRIIVSHGDVIEDNPREVLLRAARDFVG